MTRVTPTVRRAALVLLLGAAVATCRDAPTGPGRGGRASLALAPVIPAMASNLAAFGIAIDSLRVVVVRPPTDTVVDTTVFFAADQDSLALALSIPLDESPEAFNVAMELRGSGFVLFTGTASAEIRAGSNPPIPITNFLYTGPGAGITSLQVAPADSVIRFGDSLRFRVDALAGTTPVTQFYVSWSSSNASLAPINAHGVLLAPAQRAIVGVIATTPTGITDTVPVTFIPVPIQVVAVPPLPVNVPPLSPIGPLRVRVVALDGLGVKGIPVTFAAVSGGGAVGNTVVVSDTGGYAETGATSGSVGTSVFSASVTGLPPATFNVAVIGQTATQLAFTFAPSVALAGQPFTAAVEIRDAGGAVVPTATDPITIALGANPGGATLGGTLTVNAVSGLAVFGDLTINQPDSGYTLVATGPALTAATTPPFQVIPGFTGRMWTNAAGGNWSNPANWSDSIVPSTGDTVFIALDGDYVVTLDVDVDVNVLFVGGASGTQTLTGVSRTIQVDSSLQLAPTAVVNLTGGSIGGASGYVLNQGSVRLQNTMMNAATAYNFAGGSLLARGITGVSGTLINDPLATVRIEGDPTCCNTTFTVGDFSNAGLVEMTAINGSTTNVALVVLGGLSNAPGAAIAILPGTGGTRTINAQLDNFGLVQVDVDAVLGTTGAAHVNSGTVQLSGGNLTVNQSGPGSFYTDSLIVIGAGRTLTINGGTLDYDSPTPGGIAGLGTLSLNGVVFAMDTDLGNDTLNINLLNTQVLGAATLTSAAGRTLTVQGTAIAVPFVNQGTFVVRGNSSFGSTVTTVGGSIMRLLGDPACCNTTLTVASGFTNDGLLELTSTGGSTTNVALIVSSGTFNNAAGATLAVLPGTGGGRNIQAQLVNSGTVLVAHDVTLDAPSVDYLNSGLIHLTTGNLTLTQSGGTPTFAANGPIVIDAGRTFTVNGGEFQQSDIGNLGGLGTVAFNGTAFSLVAANLTHDTLSLSFVNSTVNGPGTLQNATGRTLTIQSTAVNAPFVNFGQLVVLGTSSLGGSVVTNTGSAIQVLGNPAVANAQLTVANGFTNNGLLELTQVNGPTASVTLIVPSGAVDNTPAGTIAIRAGAGGTRDLQAWINNQGLFLVEHDVTLNAPSSDHTNSGQIQLTGGNLAVIQSGTTPTFGSTGSIVVGAGRVLGVQAGAFNYQAGGPGGLAGTGTVNFAGGVVNLDQDLSNDTLTVAFTNSTVSGTGTLRSAPGRTMTIQQTVIGTPFVNQGTLVVRGASSLTAAVSALATGTIQVLGDVAVAAASLTVANHLNNEGAIALTSVGGSITSSLTLSGGITNNAGATITVEAGTGGGRAITGQVTNHGTFSVGINTTLSGTDAVHANHGTVVVSAGTLAVALSGTTPSFNNLGLINVAAGGIFVTTGGTLTNGPTGTLAGAGTFDALGTSFTNNGTIAPGGSPGQLTFFGTLPLSTSAVLSVEIGGLTPGTQYDQVVVTSGATLSGTLNVTLISGFTPAINDVFTIVSGAGVGGSFPSLNLPSVAGAIWLPGVNAAGFQLTLVSASALLPVSWTGGGALDNWSDGQNWSTLTPPGSGDSAVINLPGTFTVVVDVNATAAFLDLGTAVGAGTKTLSLGGASTLNLAAGGIVGAEGVVNFSGGTLTGGGTLQVNGAFNWSGGTISGAGVVQISPAGAMTLFGTATKFLNSRKIQTAGIVAWGDAGSIGSGGGAELVVQAGGTFAVNNDAMWLYNLGGAQPRVVVEPVGTLLRQVGTGVATLNVPIENQGGFIQVVTGTLDLRGGTSSGTFDVAAGAQIDFAGGVFTFQDGTQNSGAGLLRVAGATLEVQATTAVNRVHLASGTIQGPQSLVVQDSLVWTGGRLEGVGNIEVAPGADLVINGNVTFNSRTIRNGGTLTWLSGQISSGQGALIENQSIGLVDFRTDATWQYNQGGTPPLLTNAPGGVVQRTAGTGVLDIRAGVDNAGSFLLQSGVMVLNGGGTSAGSFNVPPGTNLRFGGAHTLAGGSSVTAGGTLEFTSGTTNVNGAYDVTGQTVVNGGAALFNGAGADTARINQLSVQSGTLGGTGVVLIRVAGTVSGGTLAGTGELRVPAGATLDLTNNLNLIARTLTNAGQVTWSAGQISSGGGAVFINQSGGVFDVPAPGNTWFYNQGGAQPVVNNQSGGLIRRAGTSGTTTFGVPLNNAGAVDVQIGALVLSVGGVASGAHTVAAGSTLQYGSTTNSWTTGADFAGAGRVLIPAGATINIDAPAPDTVDARWIELSGGTIAGLGMLRTVDSLVWTGGQLMGAGVLRIPVGGLLAIRGANKVLVARTIANAGVVSWTGTGSISSGNNAALVNENGATFQLESDADWVYNQGGAIPHIDNLTGGLIKRATAVSAINVGAALNNDGLLDLQTGSVTFTNGGASKGTLTVTSPATLGFGGGSHSFDVAAVVNGTGSVHVSAGTVTTIGDYLVTGMTRITGGTIAFDGSKPAEITTLDLNGGTLSGVGQVFVHGAGSWLSGTMRGTGQFRVMPGASLTIDGTASKTFLERTILNTGTIVWKGTGAINSGQGAVLTNQAGANFDANADANWAYNQGGTLPTFNNAGIVIRNASSDTSAIQAVVNNSGSFDISTGTLSLTNGGTSTGLFSVAAGSELDFGGGAHTISGTTARINGAGTVHFTAGSVTMSGAAPLAYDVSGITFVDGGTATFNTSDTARFTTLQLRGGTLGGSAHMVVRGSGLWTGGTLTAPAAGPVLRVPVGVTLTIGGTASRQFTARTILNLGTVSWAGGSITATGTSPTLDVQPNSTFDVSSQGQWSGASTIAVRDLANMKITVAGSVTIGPTTVINNDGLFDIQAGATLKLSGAFNQTGRGILMGSGVLDANGATTVTNAGTVRPGGTSIPGILTIIAPTGGATGWPQAAGTILDIDVVGPNVGTGFDRLVITGRITTGGSLRLIGNGSYRPAAGASLQIMTYGQQLGQTFSVSLLGGLTGLQSINYSLTDLRMQF